MNVYITTSDDPLTREQQRDRVLCLLDYALKREYGIECREIYYTKSGKPYFRNGDIYFSYSHCKYGVACAVSKSEIGVDIEYSRKINPAVIKRVCCDNELRSLENGGDFLTMWVQKEAYSKYTGKGLGEGFRNIDTTRLCNSKVFEYNGFYVAVYCEDKAEPQLKHI